MITFTLFVEYLRVWVMQSPEPDNKYPTKSPQLQESDIKTKIKSMKQQICSYVLYGVNQLNLTSMNLCFKVYSYTRYTNLMFFYLQLSFLWKLIICPLVNPASRSRQQISSRIPTAAGDNFTPVKAPVRTREQISNRVIEKGKNVI